MSESVRLTLDEVHVFATATFLANGGNPTTNPASALAGAQLPFGGYKGASIALMIELFAGALVGDLFSFEASEVDPSDGGPPRGVEL